MYQQYHSAQHQWKVIADRQYQESIQRQKQQKLLKNQIKQRYLEELSKQINQKQAAVNKERKLQKSIDRLEVDRSVQDQKRTIQIEHLKKSMINAKTQQLDNENQYYQRHKRERQKQIQDLEKTIEKSKHDQAEMLLRYDQQKQQKKKQYFRNFLKQAMQQQKQRKKTLQQHQRQLQRLKLQQLQNIQQNTDYQRARGLQRLKQRAKKVDYGSHKIFEDNQNKSLMQKKSEQWQIYKDNVERQDMVTKMEQQERMGRKVMQNYYKSELKSQIQQRQRQRRQRHSDQLMRDQSLLRESERFSQMIFDQKRLIQSQKKRQLYQYLVQQQQQRRYDKITQNAMKDEDIKFNLPALNDVYTRSPSGNGNYATLQIQSQKYKPSPGDTFRLDSQRLKQLSFVDRSLKQTDNKNISTELKNRNHRYFASKGLNVLG